MPRDHRHRHRSGNTARGKRVARIHRRQRMHPNGKSLELEMRVSIVPKPRRPKHLRAVQKCHPARRIVVSPPSHPDVRIVFSRIDLGRVLHPQVNPRVISRRNHIVHRR